MIPSYGFSVKYLTYWEEFKFQFRADKPGEVLYAPSYLGNWRKQTPLPENEVVRYPAARYRHLIRRMNISILDARKWRRGKPYELQIYESLQVLGRTILPPIISRITSVMNDCHENLTFNIEVRSKVTADGLICKMKMWEPPGDEDEEKWSKDYTMKAFEEREKEYADYQAYSKLRTMEPPVLLTASFASTYAQLVEMIWPLTAGPWKHTLAMQPDLDAYFEGVKDTIFRECAERAELDKDGENNLKAQNAVLGECSIIIPEEGGGNLILLPNISIRESAPT
ncbi:hypothetical protein ABW21_db0209571 [Orbilia brochopaga]|nr:hypothetical protein ABW21_db0209571 [Drechslerella brochopaga]